MTHNTSSCPWCYQRRICGFCGLGSAVSDLRSLRYQICSLRSVESAVSDLLSVLWMCSFTCPHGRRRFGVVCRPRLSPRCTAAHCSLRDLHMICSKKCMLLIQSLAAALSNNFFASRRPCIAHTFVVLSEHAAGLGSLVHHTAHAPSSFSLFCCSLLLLHRSTCWRSGATSFACSALLRIQLLVFCSLQNSTFVF